MYIVSFKVFHRHFKGDCSYHVETHYVQDYAYDYWNGRKTADVETIYIRKAW